MRKKKRIAKQSREGAKPSPAAGIGTHARGRAVEAGGLARAVRLVFWAGGSPPEGQGGRRRTEGAEQEEGGVWSGCAVTELVLPGGGKSFRCHFSGGGGVAFPAVACLSASAGTGLSSSSAALFLMRLVIIPPLLLPTLTD